MRQAAAAETRRRVVTAAAVCFERAGYASTTMRAIAAEAGVSVETVNGHGPKGDLLFAAFELAFAGREGAAPFAETEEARPALAPADAAEFVAAGVHVLMDAFARSEGIWRALTAAADVDEAVAERLEGMLARRRDEFAAWAAELAARGLRAADPEWATDVLIGLVNHEGYRQFVVLSGWDRVRDEEWVCRMIALNLG
ncbi:MAG TPA: helix-turn-helix domain-containing protein [Pseudolysinimonas sp.]|nr:helix-turn-helix domain-containing protein [Pseudolysinimonas sp.]